MSSPPKKVFLRSDELMMRTNVQCRMIRKTRSIAVARRRMTSRPRDTSALHHCTYFWGRLLLLKLSGFDKLRRPLTLPSNSLGALAQSRAGVILIQSANVQRCVFLSRCICYITLLQNPSLICTWVSPLALALIAARDESENAAQMIAGRRCVCVFGSDGSEFSQ